MRVGVRVEKSVMGAQLICLEDFCFLVFRNDTLLDVALETSLFSTTLRRLWFSNFT
jgi:hypothetical protein